MIRGGHTAVNEESSAEDQGAMEGRHGVDPSGDGPLSPLLCLAGATGGNRVGCDGRAGGHTRGPSDAAHGASGQAECAYERATGNVAFYTTSANECLYQYATFQVLDQGRYRLIAAEHSFATGPQRHATLCGAPSGRQSHSPPIFLHYRLHVAPAGALGWVCWRQEPCKPQPPFCALAICGISLAGDSSSHGAVELCLLAASGVRGRNGALPMDFPIRCHRLCLM
jgi:hypothetical protein